MPAPRRRIGALHGPHSGPTGILRDIVAFMLIGADGTTAINSTSTRVGRMRAQAHVDIIIVVEVDTGASGAAGRVITVVSLVLVLGDGLAGVKFREGLLNRRRFTGREHALRFCHEQLILRIGRGDRAVIIGALREELGERWRWLVRHRAHSCDSAGVLLEVPGECLLGRLAFSDIAARGVCQPSRAAREVRASSLFRSRALACGLAATGTWDTSVMVMSVSLCNSPASGGKSERRNRVRFLAI